MNTENTRTIENDQITENLYWQLCQCEELLYSRDRFITIAFHEIRNPLNSSSNILNALKETSLSAEQENLIQKLDSAFTLSKSVIKSSLALSTMDSGHAIQNRQDFKLASTVTDITNLFSYDLKIKNLDWIEAYAFDETLSLYGNKDFLCQILINLLGNACKFTKQGSITLSIKDITSRLDKLANKVSLSFSVADTGAGLQGTEFSKLKGNGVGLQLCREMLLYMDSILEVRDNPDGGTVFSFVLQFSKAKSLQDKVLVQSKADVQSSTLGKKILYIDDCTLNREFVTSLLNARQIHCDAIPCGESAIALCHGLSQDHYDLILMDANLQSMNGLETALILTHYLQIQTPMILVSASAKEDLPIHEADVQFIDFIQKPFEPDYFYDVIYKNLEISTFSEEAVRHLDGNTAQFHSILDKHRVRFLEDYKHSDQELFTLFEKNNFKELKVYAHSIIGLAGTLEFYEIAQAASTLESQISKFDYNLRPTIEAYSRALNAIFSKSSSNQQFG